jgi:membrane glycosyltransferase
MAEKQVDDFIEQAEQAQPNVVRESMQWLSHNKKWWLSPIVFGLLLVGVIVLLSGTAAAPFIYTLF